MGALVFGRASRMAWHLALFFLAGMIFSFGTCNSLKLVVL